MTRLAVLLALLVACKQGIGQRCQVDEDCANSDNGVQCNTATGTCQAAGTGSGVNGDAGLPPLDAPVDASIDSPGSGSGSDGSGSDGSGSDGSDGSGSDGSGSAGSGSGG